MLKAGYGDSGCLDWFLSIRRTLEANMQMDRLYPPGKVWWAVRADPDSTAHPKAAPSDEHYDIRDDLRLYEVLDVEKVFGQVVFARDMLSSHFPHTYDGVLQELYP